MLAESSQCYLTSKDSRCSLEDERSSAAKHDQGKEDCCQVQGIEFP